jgi:hypothetical protein
MEQRGLRRFTLVVLASLACPISAHALICPPGQKEISGRCVPVQAYHHGKSSRPAADIVVPGSAPGSRPNLELAPAAGHAPPLPSTASPAGAAANSGHYGESNRPAADFVVRPGSAPGGRPDAEFVPATAGHEPPPAEARSDAATKETSNNRKLVPVRAYLRSSEIPPPTVGAYGVVAFRAKPTPASRSRLLMTSTAFVASIEAQKSLPSTVAVSDQMLTIWPLDDPSSPNAEKDDCDFAIDHYDLYAADTAIADAETQGAKFGDDGPFLIGWSPSNTRGVPDKLVLVVDMSRYSSQDSFDHAFQFWKQEIVENPALWRTGFSIEAIRLAARDFADHYGDTILKAAVSVWKK